MTAISKMAVDKTALMVGEAHHRFFNGLQTIVAATNGILRREICDPDLRERLAALQDRVVQIANVNRRLAGPFGPESVSISAFEELFAGLAASFDRNSTLIAISVQGRVQAPERCRLLLLLVSELMMNAIKHSSLDQQLRVRVMLVVTTDRCWFEVCSNTALREGVGRPRVAAELAEAAGGTLTADAVLGEYRISVDLP